MANIPLTTSTNSGTQTATQTPQTATAANAGETASSGVQPGTASDLLNHSPSGITLSPKQLTNVSLSSTTPTSTVPLANPKHFNGGLMAISILLFVVAVLLFWITSRSVKSTTNNYK